MAYVVTVRQPCPACQYGPSAGGEHRPEVISRVEVETVERAQWHIIQNGLPASMTLAAAVRLLDGITEDGGTVTLPDGTSIQVERT